MKIKSKPIPVFQGLRVPQLSQDSGGLAWNIPLLGVSPTRLYIGNNAKGDTWTDTTGTDNLTLQAGTPTYNVAGPGANVLGVKSDGTAYFTGSSGPTTGTNDIIVAMALRWIYSANNQVFLTTRSGGAVAGLVLYTGTTGVNPLIYLNDGTDAIGVTGPTIANGQEVIVVFCANRDENSTNGAFVFSNGIAGSGVNPITVVDAIADTSALTMFADGDGTNVCLTGTTIYAAGIWLGANLFSAGATGAAEMQAVASELTQRFAGIYPQKASTGNELLTVTRATEGCVEVETGGITRVFRQGNGLQVVDDEGLEIYQALTNWVPYSTVTTTWTANAVTHSLSSVASPIAGINWMQVAEGAGTTWHGVYLWSEQALAQNQKVCIQAIVKSGDRRWINLRCGTTTGDIAGICIDTTDGSISDTGTALNGVLNSYGTKAIGDGTYIAWLTFHSTSAPPGDIYPFIAISDSADLSEGDYDQFAGDAATYPLGIYFTGAQVTPSVDFGPVPFHCTSGAAATRNATVINIDPDIIPSGDFTITGEFKLPTITTPASQCALFNISDGTANNKLELGCTATNGYGYATTVVGAASTTTTLSSAGNLFDDEWHLFTIAYKGGDKTFLKIEDSSGTNSHGKTLPARSSFTLGRDVGNANYLNGKIRNVKVYNQYLEDD